MLSGFCEWQTLQLFEANKASPLLASPTVPELEEELLELEEEELLLDDELELDELLLDEELDELLELLEDELELELLELELVSPEDEPPGPPHAASDAISINASKLLMNEPSFQAIIINKPPILRLHGRESMIRL